MGRRSRTCPPIPLILALVITGMPPPPSIILALVIIGLLPLISHILVLIGNRKPPSSRAPMLIGFLLVIPTLIGNTTPRESYILQL